MQNKLAIVVLVFLFISCSATKNISERDNSRPKSETGIQKNGSSTELAIVIHEKNERTGIDAEYEWLRKNYPGYKMKSQSLLNEKGKYYDRLDFTTANGESKSIYFDITGFYGKF